MRLPVRTVHVTTAAELDAELATADQVISDHSVTVGAAAS
jgi:hypothetical protein